MEWGARDKRRICRRVKQIRVAKYGDGRGALRAIAKELGVPYTTYRGYETNRMNLDFLKLFSNKFREPLIWLLCAEDGGEALPGPTPIKYLKEGEPFIIERGVHRIVPMLDESMEPSIKKGSLLVLVPTADISQLERKLIAIQDDTGYIRICRLIKRGPTMLGVSENPAMQPPPIVIDPNHILGVVTFQFNLPD